VTGRQPARLSTLEPAVMLGLDPQSAACSSSS
jgi:hypothetical protein